MKKLLNWRFPLTLFLIVFIYIVQDAATWTVPFGTTVYDGNLFYGKWYWTYLDYYSDGKTAPVLEGWYWIPDDEAGTHRWRITASGKAAFYLNNEKIFEGQPPANEILQEEIEVYLKPGGNFYRFEVTPHQIDNLKKLLVAIEEPSLTGWQYLQRARLYPNEPGTDPGIQDTPEENLRHAQCNQWAQRILLLAFLWLLAVIGIRVSPYVLIWRWKVVAFYAATFLIALIPRVILVLDRAAHDPEFHRLREGTDNYIYLGRAVLSGSYSIAGTLWGPGNILWMTQFQRWFGPDLLPIHMTNAVLGALVCPLLVDMTRRLYGWRAAKGTAFLAAFYPPLILFQTSSFVEGMGTTLTFVMFWLLTVYLQTTPRRITLPSFKLTRQFWYMVGLGVSLGFLGLFRPTSLVFSLVLPLTLLIMTRSLKITFWRTLPVAFFALLTIYPMTHANSVYGANAFISTNGPQTFHIGNNETSAGDWSVSVTYHSVKARGVDRTEAIINGFKDSPKRAIELIFRKLGLTWRTFEDGHLLDINRSGRTASPFFAVLYHRRLFNFSALAFIGLVGLFLSPYRQHKILWMVPLSVILFSLATAAVEGITRLRIQLVLPLMVSGGYALQKTLAFRPVDITPPSLIPPDSIRRASARRYGHYLLAAIITGAILFSLYLMETQLPRPRYFSADTLPEGTIPMNVMFDNAVKLIGYQPIEHSAYADGVLAGRFYFARVGQVEKDYMVSAVALLPDGTPILAGDWPLGHTGYPRIDAEKWPENRGLRDEYFIELPLYAAPETSYLTLGLRLYSEDGEVNVTGNTNIRSDGLVIIKHFGLIHPADSILENATPHHIKVGNIYELVSSKIPESAAPGEEISVAVLWQGLTPAYGTYQRFLILKDSAGNIVHQQDDSLFGEKLPGDALQPGQTLRVEMPFKLPDNLAPGTYTLITGVYTWPEILRLPATSENGTRLVEDTIVLGEITVE